MTIALPVGRQARTAARTTSPGDLRLETHGGALVNILRSTGTVAEFARARMRAAGVSSAAADGTESIPDWFPLEANLRVLDDIAQSFGESAVFDIGRSVPDHASFPPGVETLRQALEVLDRAFHANHRRDGLVMFDPATGGMLEGIGHYTCETSGSDVLVARSTSIYRCWFDLGLVSGLAARFASGKGAGKVEHPVDGPCRERGAPSCIYALAG